jgi:hypothetical protein
MKRFGVIFLLVVFGGYYALGAQTALSSVRKLPNSCVQYATAGVDCPF